MIILDTNVLSEPMKPVADSRVDAWLDRQMPKTLYLTAISLGEVLYGLERVAAGRRKHGLVMTFAMVSASIASEVLAFDEAAAIAYSELMGRARAAGLTLSTPDGQIAAIAKAHGFAVATRDVEPFRAAGVAVINPWESGI